MSWRTIQTVRSPRGLAIGWLIGSHVDAALVKALPGWAIVATDQAPPTVAGADLRAARTLGGCSADVPVGLFAWSGGCVPLRQVLLSRLIQPAAVAVFDGTHTDVPPDAKPWKIQVWADLMKAAKGGKLRFTATATQLAYTKDIPAGTAGRAWPASWTLGRALGVGDEGLQVGKPVKDNDLHVEVFPSPVYPKTDKDWSDATAAHLAQVTDVAPRLLSSWRDLSVLQVKPPRPVDQ